MKNWKIIFNSPIAGMGRIFVDGKELINVRTISINADVKGLVNFTLGIIPDSLEIEGVSDETNPIKYLKDE